MRRNCQPFNWIYTFFLLLWLTLPSALMAEELPATIDIATTVQANADSMEEARKKAIQEGEKQAFYKGLMQLSETQARDIYRKVRGSNLARYVESFSVTREVKRAGYYEADITYRFNRTLLEGLLHQERGLGSAKESDPEGNGLLIIPQMDAGNSLLLFDRENIWRAILNNVSLEVGQGLLVMPFGDPRDIALLPDEVLLSANKEALTKMARRYGTRNVVIALARTRTDEEGRLMAEIILRKAGAKKEDEKILQYKSFSPTDTLDIVLARAARDISLLLRDSLTDYNLFASAEEMKLKPLVLRVEFNNGKQWRAIQKIMDNLQSIESQHLRALGVNYAQITVYYRGGLGNVKKSLLSSGLDVDDSQKFWVVKLP